MYTSLCHHPELFQNSVFTTIFHNAIGVGRASMRIRRIVQFVFVAIQLSSWTAFAQQPRFKVLAFYSETTEGDHVQFAHDAVKFLTDHAASEHFAFDATNQWEDLNDGQLKGYQLLIWLNESPTDPNQRRAFERYIERGGAWLGFHAAGYNDKDTNWPWFVEFLGGSVFYINSWPPLPARLRIDDRVHSVTAGLPADFESLRTNGTCGSPVPGSTAMSGCWLLSIHRTIPSDSKTSLPAAIYRSSGPTQSTKCCI